MTLTTERQQFAEQNEMSMEFVNWFFDEKKESFGNMWFLMAAAMWEAWKGRDSREAQPLITDEAIDRIVVPLSPEGLDEEKHHCEWHLYHDRERIRKELREYFTSTPAPAVPEEAKVGEMPFLGNSEQGYVRGWNDCRTAMLAQPVSQGYKLPDGWIACSERMPASGGDKQTYVLASDFKNHYWPSLPNTQVGVYGDWFNDGNPTWDDGDGNDLHLKEVTHWMPLPAAPEGGN
ncbi:DUF551 domain-containing protein [Serratia marcescens]|uniref:DUF551 domain-containing protein n=1 Tax=Serratia marcescens TaxID=615 RepID=UPI00221E7C3A|nr:DUF551 domain-containing protein [Serratia marcescens]UYU05055.1 DUF551 domain-containing protein [Serratia marcescens]